MRVVVEYAWKTYCTMHLLLLYGMLLKVTISHLPTCQQTEYGTSVIDYGELQLNSYIVYTRHGTQK